MLPKRYMLIRRQISLKTLKICLYWEILTNKVQYLKKNKNDKNQKLLFTPPEWACFIWMAKIAQSMQLFAKSVWKNKKTGNSIVNAVFYNHSLNLYL